MLNYWWVTRPKRKLNSIPEVLATVAEETLNQAWYGERGTHLSLESALERAGLKRIGERRDRTGGGGRTYQAWLISLGLVFKQESTGQIKLTLAGEAIMAGKSPVEILKQQVIKYQIPSPFSIKNKVADDIKVRPFRFLLRLLCEPRLDCYLAEDEIGKVVVVDARKETNICYEYVVNKLISYRNYGNDALDEDYFDKYRSSRGTYNLEHPYRHLTDIANTMINWIEYTQLAKRGPDKKLRILDEKMEEVNSILSNQPPFINRPNQHEIFQRKYGVDPWHTKDTRNLTGTNIITDRMLAEEKIKRAFITISLKKPISRISNSIIEEVSDRTGLEIRVIENVLNRLYPRGAIGAFMTEYFEMAFRGRDNAIDFEKATVDLFKDVFGFEAEHVGPIGLTPDVLLLSDSECYTGIIDNKAYSQYSISNDHRNRMIHNYISTYSQNQQYPLSFFNYIAGGFGSSIDNQIQSITDETGVNGSAITVSNVIKLVEIHQEREYGHSNIRDLFSLNRQILGSDLIRYNDDYPENRSRLVSESDGDY